jgi:hypothetical protein
MTDNIQLLFDGPLRHVPVLLNEHSEVLAEQFEGTHT